MAALGGAMDTQAHWDDMLISNSINCCSINRHSHYHESPPPFFFFKKGSRCPVLMIDKFHSDSLECSPCLSDISEPWVCKSGQRDIVLAHPLSQPVRSCEPKWINGLEVI